LTIEELEQIEAKEKAQRKNKRIMWIAILTPIILIATCNVYINTHQENAILENPEPGDYFVFSGLIGKGDQPFKLKAIQGDTMEFLVPSYEFINFKFNKSESKVYELDRKGELYSTGYTIKINKYTIDKLRNNSKLGVRLNNSEVKVYLKNVFGRNRGNAVESALEKVVGKDSVNK